MPSLNISKPDVLSIGIDPGDPDLYLSVAIDVFYGERVPSPRPKPLVRVFRRGTKRVRGKTEIEQYGVIGVREAKPNEKPAAADVVGKDGSVEHQLQGDPYVHGVNSDLWVVTISSQPGGANVSFEVQVELPGTNPLVKGTTTSGPMGIARQQFNAAKPTVQRLLPGDFKRLVVGLNLAPTSPPPERINAASGTAGEIKKLLDHIAARLRGGLRSAWDASIPAGAGSSALLGSPTEPLRAALEDWAMTASELLTLSPYGSPGAMYALSEAKIVTAGLAPGKAEPFIHITSACQQLVSAALAARGVSFPPAKAGLNAGSAARDTWTKDLNGKWITAQGGVPSVQAPATFGDLTNLPDATMQQATTLFKIDELTEAKATLGLGAVFLYSNRKSRDDETHFIGGSVEYEVDPKRNTQSEWGIRKDGFLRDNTAGAHVGMVLRSDPRTKRFQLLDTGGCGAPGWGDGVSALQANKGFHGGIFEGPSCTQVGAGKDPLRGAGVFAKPADAGAEKKLADEISAHLKDVSKKARPLGLVRLVLLNPRFKVTLVNVARFREQNWLHYASPLLPMWEGDQDSGLNYSIARYLFSLRDLPGLPELKAFWFFYAPQKELAEVMLRPGARTKNVAQLANDALGSMEGSLATKLRTMPRGEQVSRVLAERTFPVADGTVLDNGQVLVSATYRSFSKMHPLHMIEGRWGSAPLLPLGDTFLGQQQELSALHPYFKA